MESAQTRKARSWLVEGISTGSVQSDTVYDIFDADADSTAQGSTRGRTQLRRPGLARRKESIRCESRRSAVVGECVRPSHGPSAVVRRSYGKKKELKKSCAAAKTLKRHVREKR